MFSSYTAEKIQMCELILKSFADESNGPRKYPVYFVNNKENEITKDTKLALAVYLADKYLINFESSHCQPLSSEYFRIPWSESSMRKLNYTF